MENSLSYIIFCWFFATSTHQRINFYVSSKDKITLKFCESFRFFLAVFTEKIKIIRYLNYVRRRVGHYSTLSHLQISNFTERFLSWFFFGGGGGWSDSFGFLGRIIRLLSRNRGWIELSHLFFDRGDFGCACDYGLFFMHFCNNKIFNYNNVILHIYTQFRSNHKLIYAFFCSYKP